MHKFIESGNPFLTTVYHFSVNDSVKNISALSINRTLIDEIFYSGELCNLNSFLFKRRDVCTVPNESIRKTETETSFSSWTKRLEFLGEVGSISLLHNA